MSNKINVLWSTSLDLSGYSNSARNFVKALYQDENFQSNIHIKTISGNIDKRGISQEDIDFFYGISSNDIMNKDNIFIQHNIPDRMVYFKNKKNIIYTFCEVGFTRNQVYNLNKCDLIFTCSDFSKQKMIESGVDISKLYIVPLCYDNNIWNKEVKPLKINNLKSYNFLFMADYTPRKGGDLLIRNYLKAFKGNKDVSLTIKAYYSGFNNKDVNKLINRVNAIIENYGIEKSDMPAIYFYSGFIKEELMPNFMASFDCLVSPHKAEGWGLSISQMMSLGKSVIATKYSGNLEFMDDQCSYLIDIDGMGKVCDEMVLINKNFKDKEWAVINEKDLRDKMIYVYHNRKDAEERSLIAYNNMKKYRYKNISQKIYEIFLKEGIE